MPGRVVLPFESSPSFEILEIPPARPAAAIGSAADSASIPMPVLAESSDRVAALAPIVDRDVLVSPRMLARLLVALLVLNAIDAVMTLWAVRLGVATEANPLMAAALEIGEPVFLASKFAVVGAGCAVLWAARHRRIAQIGASVCVGVYAVLAFVHVWTGTLIAEALSGLAAVV